MKNPLNNLKSTDSSKAPKTTRSSSATATSATAATSADASPTHQPSSHTTTPDTATQSQQATLVVELTNDLQRTRADFENYRKQVDSQKAQARQLAALATVSKLLPLLDDMSRAIAATPALQPLQKTLDKTLSELQLQTMDTTPGTPFNPDFHDAVSVEAGDGATEVIAETLRPGYLYQGQVLRPAMVKVKN